jgi:hypothetical protein
MWCPCLLSLVYLKRLYQPSQVINCRYTRGTSALYSWDDHSSTNAFQARSFRPMKFVIILRVFTNEWALYVYCIRHNMYIMSIRSFYSRQWCLMNNYGIHPNMFLGSKIHWSELNSQAYIVIRALQKFHIYRVYQKCADKLWAGVPYTKTRKMSISTCARQHLIWEL